MYKLIYQTIVTVVSKFYPYTFFCIKLKLYHLERFQDIMHAITAELWLYTETTETSLLNKILMTNLACQFDWICD